MIWLVDALSLFLHPHDENETYKIYEEAFLVEGELVFCLLYHIQSLPSKREAF